FASIRCSSLATPRSCCANGPHAWSMRRKDAFAAPVGQRPDFRISRHRGSTSGMNKVIWTCWLQGRENAPPTVEKCLASWERKNPGWTFRCLDATSIERYVALKHHIDLDRQTITAASLSDILRMLLLREFGGVWVDATLLCAMPLDEWLPA